MSTYKCHKCGNEFDQLYFYNRHMNRKTSCVKQNNCECEKCGKIFTRPSSLNYHVTHKVCEKRKIN